MTQPTESWRLPLHELHESLGATMRQWNGWIMPVDYGDRDGEYRAIRSGAAVCDQSPGSKFTVSGTDALDVLKAVTAGHVEELEEGRAMRTAVLDDEGRVRDLVLIARSGGISYLVFGESSQRFETHDRLQRAVQEDYDVRIDDRTESTCLVNIVGPNAAAMVQQCISDEIPSRVQSMQSSLFEFHGFRTMAVRTSSTGEDGFLLMLAPAVAMHLIETLAKSGAVPAGIAAQETARVEACIPAFARDLQGGLTPAEADLDALFGLEAGPRSRLLSGVMMDSEPLEPGTAAHFGGALVGELRSCLRSPLLDSTIGLAVLNQEHATPGVELVIGGSPATVVSKPFLRRRQTP